MQSASNMRHTTAPQDRHRLSSRLPSRPHVARQRGAVGRWTRRRRRRHGPRRRCWAPRARCRPRKRRVSPRRTGRTRRRRGRGGSGCTGAPRSPRACLAHRTAAPPRRHASLSPLRRVAASGEPRSLHEAWPRRLRRSTMAVRVPPRRRRRRGTPWRRRALRGRVLGGRADQRESRPRRRADCRWSAPRRRRCRHRRRPSCQEGASGPSWRRRKCGTDRRPFYRVSCRRHGGSSLARQCHYRRADPPRLRSDWAPRCAGRRRSSARSSDPRAGSPWPPVVAPPPAGAWSSANNT